MFDYLKNLSKKNMLIWTIASYVVYFGLSIFAPVLTIAIKYGLFTPGDTTTSTSKSLTGWGLVLLMIAIIVGFRVLKNASVKIPDSSKSGAIFKIIVRTTSNVLLPIAIIAILYFLTKNFELAKGTLLIMCYFYIGAGIIDGIWLYAIDRENAYRDKARALNEVQARQDKV